MAKAKILLVEDNPFQAELTKKYLINNGYEVILAGDGKSAIKIAKTEPIDLIILDVILPDINGYEIARWLRISDETKGLPIIMLSEKKKVEDKVSGLEAGADDYLPKPYNEIELNATIYACLRTKALQDELRKKNKQLEEILKKVEVLAITDSLTGLYNRRHFENMLGKEFKKANRYNIPLTCMMIDLDHFKEINDAYGHHKGDEVIKEVSKKIKDSIRDIDIAARWGGEEFIVLLPMTNKENAYKAAERIANNIKEIHFPEIKRQLTVSVGIAEIPNPAIKDVEKLVQMADLALYEAKRKGRNRIEII